MFKPIKPHIKKVDGMWVVFTGRESELALINCYLIDDLFFEWDTVVDGMTFVNSLLSGIEDNGARH